jgi:Ankyrin repeats (3 copies)
MLARGVVALAVLALSGAGCGEDEGARDPSRDLALVVAAGTGQLEEVKRLLQEGASVDAKDAVGNTALLAAALTNRVAVAEVLMEAGSDVNEPDRRQQSAYLVATSESETSRGFSSSRSSTAPTSMQRTATTAPA